MKYPLDDLVGMNNQKYNDLFSAYMVATQHEYDREKLHRLLKEYAPDHYHGVAERISGAPRFGFAPTEGFVSPEQALYAPHVRFLTGGGTTGPDEENIKISCKASEVFITNIVENLIPENSIWDREKDCLLHLLWEVARSSSILSTKVQYDTEVSLNVIIGMRRYNQQGWAMHPMDASMKRDSNYLHKASIHIGENLTFDLGTGICPVRFGNLACSLTNRTPDRAWISLSTPEESILMHSTGTFCFYRKKEIADMLEDPHGLGVTDLVRMLFPEAAFLIDKGDCGGYPTVRQYMQQPYFNINL